MWQRLCGRRGAEAPALAELQREVEALRRALQAREQQLQHAQAHLHYTRETEQQRIIAQADALLTSLLRELAPPLTQLATQLHLLEQGTALPPTELLKTVQRLLRTLEAWGVHLEGQLGTTEPYDPTRHLVLSLDAIPHEGQPVIVRTCGLLYKGILIYKVGVEPAE